MTFHGTVSKGPCFGQRHVLVLLSGLGITVMYCMRINLSVALVAMVNATAVEGDAKQKPNISHCPLPSNTSHATPGGLETDGTFVWSRQLQGLILSSFFWGYVLLQIPASSLALRFGGKKVLLCGVVWTTVFTALTPLIVEAGPYWLIFFRILEGFGEGVTYPSIQCMFGRWIPQEEATFLISIAFAGSIFGTIIGQLVSGPLCQSAWGWPSTFYASAVAGIVWCVPWIIFVSDSPDSNRRISNEEAAYISLHVGAISHRDRCRDKIPWRHIFTDSAVWASVIALTTFNWTFYVMITCLPQYLSDVLHFDIATNGLYSSLPYIISLPFTFVPGYIFTLIVRRGYARAVVARKLLSSFGFFGIAGCLFGITWFPCDAILSVVLLGVTMCLVGVIQVATTPNFIELSPEFSGSLLALGNSCGTIGGILAPYVTDLLTPSGTIEEWSHVFYLGIGMSVFGALVFVIFGSTEKRKWNSLNVHSPIVNEDTDISSEVNIAT